MRIEIRPLILAVALLTACSNASQGAGTDLAVAAKLVGHWSTSGNDNLYYGAIDPATGIGSFVMVHPDGKVFNHRYHVDSATASDRTIRTTLLFADGDSREETFVLSEDGTSLETATVITDIDVHGEQNRVDAKTAP